MFEFVKLLVEEPEKLRKVVIAILKYILSTLIASKIYVSIYGEYDLLDIPNQAFWAELFGFIITGKILIVFFLFLVAKFILFDVFARAVDWIVEACFKKIYSLDKYKNDPDFIHFVLKWLKIISIEKNTGKIVAGSKFDDYYNLLISYKNDGVHEEVQSLKKSLMNETLHFYFVFTLIYFLFLEINQQETFSFVLIAGLVLNMVIYLIIHSISTFLRFMGEDIFFGMRLMNQEIATVRFLNENKIQIIEPDVVFGTATAKLVHYLEKKYYLVFYPSKHPISILNIEKLIKRIGTEDNLKIIIISNIKTSKAVKHIVKERNFPVKVLYIHNDDSLNKKLENLFF